MKKPLWTPFDQVRRDGERTSTAALVQVLTLGTLSPAQVLGARRSTSCSCVVLPVSRRAV
jgi:hypothetical protein